uniref:S-acyltransferase n=1 Tax=Oryza punctata TaxID=4537 RepID=A0A0E0LXC2_ORYPU
MYMPQPSRSAAGGRDAGDQPRVYQVWRGSNEFFLQGRFIFGPDVRSIFLTMFLIVAPVVAFCVFVARHLIDDFPGDWGISVMVVVVVFTVYDLTLLLLTSGRDPGIIPRNTHPPEPEGFDGSNDSGVQTPQQLRLPRTKDVIVNGISVRIKYCDTCMLYRPPRCSHCSICNNCVERSVPILIIGKACAYLFWRYPSSNQLEPNHNAYLVQRNYRFFYMFVFSTTLLCLYVFAFCWVYIIKIRNAENLSVWKAMLKTPASIVLIIYCFLCVWFVGGLSVFHCYLMSTNQTTYENFRYRYDRRANPYNRGVLNNFLEIFCSRIPPSKNNFRARVTVEQGLQQTRVPSRGFMSPNMGKPAGDLEMGRKPVPWDEPRTAADIRDLEAGLGGFLDEKEGRLTHASPDLSRDDLPADLMEGRAGTHSRRSSWVHRTGTSESVDSMNAEMIASWLAIKSDPVTTSRAH